MGKLCSKSVYAFSWTLFECLFFSGVVVGWTWFIVLFRGEGYFIDMCNTTNLTIPISMLDISETPSVLEPHLKSKDTVPVVRKKKCRVVHVQRKRTKRSDGNVTVASVEGYEYEWVPMDNGTLEPMVFSGCYEQTDQLRMMFSIVFIVRDILALPLGIFLDEYGTTRTRLLTVLVFAVGTLMMTFTKSGIPWLFVPALSLTSIAGTSVLLTNLQVGNLFTKKRHTIVALYVGAQQSGAMVALLIRLCQYIGVNIQSSFMFMTVGIVPLLVSTIAFLPKSRIPWPLPADYGKRRNQSLDEAMLRKQRAWQRRMSEVGYNASKYRRPHPDFSPHIIQPLYIWLVVWYSVQNLQIAVFDNLYVDRVNYQSSGYLDYEKLYGCVQLLGIVFAPMAGAWMDKRRPRELGLSPGTQQMTNLLPVMVATSVLGISQSIVTLIPIEESQIFALLLSIVHRVFLMSNFFSFLMHVHFPQQHFGKFVGLAMLVSAIISAFQFPIKEFLVNHYKASLYVNTFLLVLCIATLGHPVNVWNQCINRLIRDPIRIEHKETNSVPLTLPPEFVLTVTEANGEVTELVPGEVLPNQENGNGDIPEIVVGRAPEIVIDNSDIIPEIIVNESVS